MEARGTLPDMGDPSKCDQTCEAQHGQMGMSDYPVGKVDEPIDRHQRLERTLQTHDEVDHDSCPNEQQGRILPDFGGFSKK